MRQRDKTPRRYLRRAMGFVRGVGVSGCYLGLVLCAVFGSLEIQQQVSPAAWISTAEAGDDEWKKEAREAEREARRQRREMEKEANRQQREMAKEENRQRREMEKEANRQRREMAKEENRQRREVEKEANRHPSRDDEPASKVDRRAQDEDRESPAKTVKADASSGREQDDKHSDRGRDKSTAAGETKDDAGIGKKKLADGPEGKQALKEKPSNQGDRDDDDEFEKPSPPPKTAGPFIKWIFTPAKPKPQPVPVTTPPTSPSKSANKTAAAPPKPVALAKPKAGSKPVAAVRRGAPDFELLQQGMFRPNEILATNLSPAEQKFAEANGFKAVSSVQSPGDSGTVSSLIVPPGMSEAAAIQFLESAAPSALFGPNHVYRIVPAADGPVPAAARDGLAATGRATQKIEGGATGGPQCAAGECFARDLLAWKPATKQCARRVRVGLIDTSFDVAHPAFAGKKFSLEQFTGKQTIARGDWHGTAVLSVLAGNASSSTPGLIPDADFFLASTFRADAQGNAAADTISVLKALAWLDKNNVNIVNMSFSGPRNDQIEVAIAAMAAKGVVFVAAAGNRGPSAPPSYPAAYPQVVAVTAIGKKLNSYLHANRGDYIDVAAPGVQVLTALPEGRQGLRTGTSFATPFITGLLAAMPAVRKGAVDKAEMLSRISFQDLGDSGRDAIYGEGLPKAPESCDGTGGIAALPWLNEAKRMSVGAPTPAESALARPASR